jgi:hypothetical protein
MMMTAACLGGTNLEFKCEQWFASFSSYTVLQQRHATIHPCTSHLTALPEEKRAIEGTQSKDGKSGPVVGNRVEVLWRGELHAAEVVKCHRTGEFNVVYETDGTVRTFVTREDNRLVPLAKREDVEIHEEEEEGREGEGAAVQKKPVDSKRRKCEIEGCTKKAKNIKVRGACITHGAYGMCLIGGCTTMAVNKSQRCKKHGAKGL